MDYIQEIVGRKDDEAAVLRVLDDSLNEKDPHCAVSRKILGEMGLAPEAALMLLAHHKSNVKYGCRLSTGTLSRILKISKSGRGAALAKRRAA